MAPFEDYCARVERHIEKVYGLRIITRDIPDPLTGDLNGVEIHLDDAITPEQRFFLVAHLFGHTVQWNTDPDAFQLGQPRQVPVSEDCLTALMNYEREAAGYALSLLHEIGIHEMDQWFADYAACDAAYLRHYYLTGQKRNFESFYQVGMQLIEERPVPRFTPARKSLRSDGIVI